MIEQELKVLLNKDQYDILDKALTWDKEFTQKNNYYTDGAGEVLRQGITIRIRQIGDEYKLQIKEPLRSKGSLEVKQEKEKIIDGIYEKINKETYGDMLSIDVPALYLMGKLVTRRKTRDILNCEIALDENNYFDKTDYELEIEYTGKEVPLEVFKIIEEHVDLDFTENAYGKLGRFLREYDDKEKKS